ncbi:MAG TPA: Rid family hydrolase [Trebonia sp.]|jgi:enamine deaminase RidA (YjgF/YER057c/UK114 family)|nr:Rid family hydrolase [Trebonia sp.]
MTGASGTAMVRKVSSGAPWEESVGYSRAVAAGDYIFVSGCTSVQGGQIVHDGDPGAQAGQAIANVEAALAALGASLADVVRTRMFVTDMSCSAQVGAAHQAAFGPVRPATSMLAVAALIDPRLLVEVEAVAYRPAPAPGAGLGWPA